MRPTSIRRPNGPGRAKISGNWLTVLTVFLVRARGAAPGGPPAKSTPTAARLQPDRSPATLYSEMVFLLGAVTQGPQSAPRVPQEASKTVQDGSESPNKRPKTPKMAFRRPSRPPRSPKRASRGSPRGPQQAKIVPFPAGNIHFSHIRRLAVHSVQTCPRGPQDRPKTAQQAPKMGPRGPKRAPRRPKRAPKRPKRREAFCKSGFCGTREPARGPNIIPRTP